MAAKHNKRRHMKNDTPHTLDHFSAQDALPSAAASHIHSAHWLEKCESHDSWHELSEEQRKPTLANVAAFLSLLRSPQTPTRRSRPAIRKPWWR
jgi:hypothetical protein